MLHHMLRAAAQRAFNVLDPYFQYVTMLLHGDGTNGAQNNTFLDSSTNNFTITRNGNTTQGTFTPYGANWSVSFTGAQTSPSLTYPSISAYDLGATSQWTYECWVYFASLSGEQSIMERWSGTGGPGWLLTKLSSNAYRAHFGSSVLIDTGAIAVAGQWIHLAVSRDGSTGSLFVDGVRQATTSSVANFSDGTDPLVFGERNSGSQTFPFNGYISNARIVKSTYVYNPSSTTITVPTSPLTAITNTVFLGLQSNRYIDNSSNNATATVNSSISSVQRFSPFSPTTAYSTSVIGGSGYFDGNTDYLSVSNSGLFGSGDWSIEFWVNAPVGQTDKPIIDARNSAGGSGSTTGFTIGMISSTEIRVWSNGEKIRATANYVNQWLHFALVKSGSTTTMYFNGVSVGTTTAIGTMSDTSFLVGAGYYGSTSINAYGNFYTSNMRVVKGSAVYTSNFTPPTAPVTAISSTALLMDYTNAGILDNAMMNDLETVGNAQISTSVKKYGTGSMAFDGSGDYLKPNMATPDLYAFGSGDFTIEFWGYILQTTPEQMFIDWRPAGTQTTQPLIYVTSAGVLAYYVNAANRITGATLSTSTWYHIAVSRSGTSTKMFLNGTQTGSTWTDTTVYTNVAGRPVISLDGNTTNSGYLNGYIDDLRITKGVARYTANFTAPTAAFPNN